MFNLEEYKEILTASSQRDFLNLMEAYFHTNFITRYMYAYLPLGAQFNSEKVEIYQYGYEDMPENLDIVSTFLRSPDGARFAKHTISGTLKPFNWDSPLLETSAIKAKGAIVKELNETECSLYIPVHAGGSQTGLFFFRGEKETAIFFNNPRGTQAFCQLLHQKYCELSPEHPALKFTNREREVINWMAQGKSNAVIGKILDISKHTVDAHLRAIFFKLSVTNRTAASVKASQLGLLQY